MKIVISTFLVVIVLIVIFVLIRSRFEKHKKKYDDIIDEHTMR